MKIANTGPVSTSPLRRRERTSRSSSSFASELAGEQPVRDSAATADAASVSTLLSIQEVGDPADGRRRAAVRRGEDLLDRLDELRLGLLTGTFPAEKLDQLLAVVRRRRDQITDPGLADILADIELRASVELAKLGKFS